LGEDQERNQQMVYFRTYLKELGENAKSLLWATRAQNKTGSKDGKENWVGGRKLHNSHDPVLV